MRIDTEIERISVEIEGEEYLVAENTIAVAEKLAKAQKDAVGQPMYKYWMTVVEILLGKEAHKRLFKAGKNENLDRVERIAKHTMRAFAQPSIELEDELERDKIDSVSDRIQPVNEFLRQVNKLSDGANKQPEKHDNVKVIHRG